jgi:hypothetical protein
MDWRLFDARMSSRDEGDPEATAGDFGRRLGSIMVGLSSRNETVFR